MNPKELLEKYPSRNAFLTSDGEIQMYDTAFLQDLCLDHWGRMLPCIEKRHIVSKTPVWSGHGADGESGYVKLTTHTTVANDPVDISVFFDRIGTTVEKWARKIERISRHDMRIVVESTSTGLYTISVFNDMPIAKKKKLLEQLKDVQQADDAVFEVISELWGDDDDPKTIKELDDLKNDKSNIETQRNEAIKELEDSIEQNESYTTDGVEIETFVADKDEERT